MNTSYEILVAALFSLQMIFSYTTLSPIHDNKWSIHERHSSSSCTFIILLLVHFYGSILLLFNKVSVTVYQISNFINVTSLDTGSNGLTDEKTKAEC